MIQINSSLLIPESEITLEASRSSGPGGQNVNKVSTRMTLIFDVLGSSSLNDLQRQRIQERLGKRVSGEGLLRVSSDQYRTQSANRKAVIDRFAELLAGALRESKVRKKTRVSRAARRRRLEEKTRHAEKKRSRQKPSLPPE